MAVVVTGFGPFRNFKNNISSETVELFERAWDHEHGELITFKNIEVSFSGVREVIPKIWGGNPRLVVHLGVHGDTDVIVLESRSSNSGYCSPDVNGIICENDGHCIPPEKDIDDVIQTKIDTDKIRSALQDKGIPSVISCDPGAYLCGFIYYNSLSIDSSRCLFVHVPPHKKSSPAELAKALHVIVQEALKQV